MISILVVDDHDLVRMGISRMLSDDSDFEVIGEADSGDMAIKKARELNPDIVLLDVNMPNIGGVEATKRLIKIDPDMKIIALSSLTAHPYPSMLLKAGVRGYITKGIPISEMTTAIKTVYAGRKYFCREVAEQIADVVCNQGASPFDLLSERETQVAMMIVNCQSAQQIADQLFVSVKTINTYRYRIFDKVGVDSDVKLTHLAMRYGILEQFNS